MSRVTAKADPLGALIKRLQYATMALNGLKAECVEGLEPDERQFDMILLELTEVRIGLEVNAEPKGGA